MDQVNFRTLCTAVLFAFVLFLHPNLLEAQAPSAYQVKAAFLLNFTKFIDWPNGAFENSGSPLTICVFGDDPFGIDIDQVLEGETVKGRKLVVERLGRTPPSPKACQVLFLSRSEKDISKVLSGLGPGVLTVSDRDRFLLEGGMIAMFIEDAHLRFDISQRAALRASLSMNARLLNVARKVDK